MDDLRSFVEDNIRLHIIAVIWVLYLWELYLALRQRKLMQKMEVRPNFLDGVVSDDVYQKSRAYCLDKNTFSNYSDLYSTVINTVFIAGFCFHYFWLWSIRLIESFGMSKDNEILGSAVCMLIMNIVTTLTGFPFKIYNVFVVENAHGFNKQSLGFFLKDQLKKYIVIQTITLPFLCAMLWIVKYSGDIFFFYVWIFTIVVTLFMSIIYPEVIAPMFDKYSPLPEGKLKESIEALAASVDYPLYKIFIVEGSKRSTHSNAYLYGFWKHKRIVLFDTLLKGYCKAEDGTVKEDQGCELDEVVAVLAHELGHWKYSHAIKSLFLVQISFWLNILPFAFLLKYTPMYVAFGFTDSQPVFIGLIIVTMYILTPLNTLVGFLLTMNSRRFEFQADQFGKQLGHAEALKRALVKLQTDNLSFPLVDSLYSGWHHSHPPTLERLRALDKVE